MGNFKQNQNTLHMKLTAFAAVLAAVSALRLREEEVEEDECDFIGDFHACCYDSYPEEACDEVWECMDGDVNPDKLEGCVVELGYDDLSSRGSGDEDDDASGSGDDDDDDASGSGDDVDDDASGSGDDVD